MSSVRARSCARCWSCWRAPRAREHHSPRWRATTLSGLAMSFVALVTWWSCNAFMPLVANGLAAATATAQRLEPAAARALGESWKALATNCFNMGGLLGTLFTVPLAKSLGRRPMYALYCLCAGVAVMCAFGLPMPSHTRLYTHFFIGLGVFGVFGSFTYYLPELYPTRLRGTGPGFCYNARRVVCGHRSVRRGQPSRAAARTRSRRRCACSGWVRCRWRGCCCCRSWSRRGGGC